MTKQLPLHLFQTERQHVTSDGLDQDAGDRVHYLHLNLVTHRRPEHHTKHRGRVLHQPPLQQHLFVVSYHSFGTGHGQLKRCQLLRLRPEVVTVSSGAGNICVFQVFKARKGGREESGCDCEHNDNRSVGCVQLRDTVEKTS